MQDEAMTEVQMMELAAKAIGYKPTGEVWMGGLVCAWDGKTQVRNLKQHMVDDGDKIRITHTFVWNPRNDDGDSRRLQNHLRIGVEYGNLHTVAVWCAAIEGRLTEHCQDGMGADIDDKTRLAVLRAAAEFGKAMH